MVRVGDYELAEEVGRGAFSLVRLAKNRTTNETLVAKVVSRNNQNVDQDIRREIAILRRLRHDHVVRLVNILESPNNYYIMLEAVLGGDMCDYIMRSYPKGMPTVEVQRLFAQLISGVGMCHGVGVAHRDLKPENLLMSKDDPPSLKISDFGLSRLHRHSQVEAQPHEYAQTVAGTLAYVAPEVLQGQGYDAFKADMWSLGCILYVMCTGRFAFGAAAGAQLERRIMAGEYDPIPPQVDLGAADVIKRLLVKDPAARMMLPELAAHPFLAARDCVEVPFSAVVEDDLTVSFAATVDVQLDANTSPSFHSQGASPHMSPSHKARREQVRNGIMALANDSSGDDEPSPAGPGRPLGVPVASP